MTPAEDADTEKYSPWTLVNVVFSHLVSEGFHPTLGDGGDPGAAAHDLLTALGIEPDPHGGRQVMRELHEELAELRTAYEES